MNLPNPNSLSWARIVAAPLVAALYLPGGAFTAAALAVYILAAVTDVLDGMLARASNHQTRFGVFIDPVADKILVVTVLIMLLAKPNELISQLLLGLFAGLVILREIAQSALRDWMSQSGRTAEVAVTGLSKTKTITQMIALGFLIGVDLHVWLQGCGLLLWYPPAVTAGVGLALLGISAALGLVTLALFLRAAFGRGS